MRGKATEGGVIEVGKRQTAYALDGHSTRLTTPSDLERRSGLWRARKAPGSLRAPLEAARRLPARPRQRQSASLLTDLCRRCAARPYGITQDRNTW